VVCQMGLRKKQEEVVAVAAAAAKRQICNLRAACLSFAAYRKQRALEYAGMETTRNACEMVHSEIKSRTHISYSE